MSVALTAEQRLARVADEARAAATIDGDRAVAKAVRDEERRIERESAREHEAEQVAHYRSEFAIENDIEDLPRSVTDLVWSLAWEQGHSSGFAEVGHHYSEIAPIAAAAYEAGKSSTE